METTKKDKKKDNNLVELEASLAPAVAEVGAVAKADQNKNSSITKHIAVEENDDVIFLLYHEEAMIR